MFELSKDEMNCLTKLCEGKSDVEFWACIEGNMGRAWVDRKDAPSIAIVIVADFCFLLGEFHTSDNIPQIKELLEGYKGKIIMTEDTNWISFIEQNYHNNIRKFSRYYFKKEKHVFQRDRLSNFIRSAEDKFQIVSIGEDNYNRVLQDSFMADCCCFFSSMEDFLRNGIGYIIEQDGEIIAAASSYSYCKGNISITIGTKESYRRKGLAAGCASKLILNCLEKDIYPHWDAANLGSVALAEKLGYNFERAYEVYSIY